jgi:hypothetical protein
LEEAGLIPTWMLTKTSFCKHKYGCYENVIIGFYKLLVKSFAIKFLINNLLFLGNKKKFIQNIFSLSAFKDNARFAIFACLVVGVYKAMLCILRRIFKNEKLATSIAGFIAGLMAFIEIK